MGISGKSVREAARAGFALAALSWLCGCQSFEPPTQASLDELLQPVQTARDSVALEVFQLRVAADDDELTEDLWRNVDEQRLDVELRRQLIGNGFRLGILGGTLPDVLAQRLNLQSHAPEVSTIRQVDNQAAQPRVTRRVLQLGPQESATLQASKLRDDLHVLLNKTGHLKGRSFQQIQAVYTLEAERAAGQRVALRLTPELQHGELRNRYTGGDSGIFLFTPSRDREVYDWLTVHADLAPGELLLLSCLPSASGSLGHAFHVPGDDGPNEHKLILVRLLQVPASEILADAVASDW